MAAPWRVVYAGTSGFAVPALERLVADGHDVVAVYTQPDRPAGRGRRLRPSPVKEWAEQTGLSVRQPESLRGRAAQDALRALAPDVMVVAAYGLMLPRTVLQLPIHQCLNIHASLLPRWRGAAPIQRAIQAGDATTGVCVMRMAPSLDSGPLLGCRTTEIAADESAGSVHDRLAMLGAALISDVLPRWLGATIQPQPQDESLATYAHKLTRQEAWLDWSRAAVELARTVRAFNPFPVARARHGDTDLQIWSAVAVPQHGDRPAGSVLAVGAQGVDVATGAGILRLTELQAPGRRRQPAVSFLNGYRICVGERLR